MLQSLFFLYFCYYTKATEKIPVDRRLPRPSLPLTLPLQVIPVLLSVHPAISFTRILAVNTE